jgi:hypothetical protein
LYVSAKLILDSFKFADSCFRLKLFTKKFCGLVGDEDVITSIPLVVVFGDIGLVGGGMTGLVGELSLFFSVEFDPSGVIGKVR